MDKINENNVKEIIASREKEIFKTSVIGIAVNLLLVGFKAFVGLLSNSIAIILDAINNLSDALSSVTTIIGMRLAGKPADKKHPIGYGRVEYLSSAIISLIVIYAGISSLVSSVKQIINPEKADYSKTTLIIVGVAVVVKLVLGTYVKKAGKRVDSDALVASGTDAFFDSIISLSTIVAAVIYLVWGVSLEAYLGVIISAVIIKSGIDLIRETLSKILGERVDGDLSHAIKKTVCSAEEVRGAYDLILHNYGPNTLMGSIHIEIPDYLTADKIDALTRDIQRRVLKEHGIFISAVSIYSYNTKDEEAIKIRNDISKMIFSNERIIQVHGFYLDRERKVISVDFVAEFGAPYNLTEKIKAQILEKYPEYSIDIAMDTDISD